MPSEKVLRIQADKLAKMLEYPPNTHFDISELETLRNAEIGTSVDFRGITVSVTPSMKSTARIVLFKINNLS
jgi:hypothetical protein